jgi:ribosome modulation factor
MLTPIILNGYVQLVHSRCVMEGVPVYLYGEEFNSPYCPLIGDPMTAFEQGYAAFLKGLQRDENPFNAETCSFSLKRWADGWNKAYRARQEKQT